MAAAVLALALAAFGLTACGDTDDDCDDASSATVVHYEPAGFDARIGGTTGSRGGTTGMHTHHDDCEDED
jgi:hypothetical protein